MPRFPSPLLLLCLLPLACDRADSPPTIADRTPEQAAEVVTEVACEYVERCGELSITCADCEGDGAACGGCTVEVVPVEHDACVDHLTEDFVAGFGCVALTDEEQAAADACLGTLGDWACPDPELAEAWANGGGGPDPTARPAGCDVLEDIRYRCSDDGGDAEPEPAD
jgi:hypothetical protein